MANEQPHCFPFLQKELQLTVNLHWQFPYVSCTMAALFQAIDNIMQYPCLILFHTFSYCLTLLIPLYIILLEACFILFHFFASSCPISHTRTHAQTHTHREQQLLCREEDTLLVKLLSVALLNGSMNLMKV